MKVRNKNVFLSGPMTGREAYNVGEFAKAHARLKELGAHCIYDPALEYLQEGNAGHSHEWYMRRCIQELTKDKVNPLYESGYTILVSLPDWQESQGARVEREVAIACGIAVCDLGECE